MNEARIARMQEKISRYYEKKLRAGQMVHKAEDVAQWFTAKIGSSRVERMWALALDGSQRVITWKELSTGTINVTCCYVRELVRWALMLDAVSIILAHNHPSGTLQFSHEDITLSQDVRNGLKFFRMKLLDHVIVTPEGKYVSAVDKGLL